MQQQRIGAALQVFKYINKKIKQPVVLNNIATCYYYLWKKSNIYEYYILAQRYRGESHAHVYNYSNNLNKDGHYD